MFKIVEFSHYLIKEHFNRINKDYVIFVDATCGMGHDSLFMAETIYNKGIVVCYDIQEVAIEETKKRLQNNGFENVIYKNTSHVFIDERADLVIFNLGYLPSHDKSITTNVETTMKSLTKVLELQKENTDMLIIIVVYPGHEEGLKESIIIDEFTRNLPSNYYLVSKYQNYNRPTSPYIITISKDKRND